MSYSTVHQQLQDYNFSRAFYSPAKSTKLYSRLQDNSKQIHALNKQPARWRLKAAGEYLRSKYARDTASNSFGEWFTWPGLERNQISQARRYARSLAGMQMHYKRSNRAFVLVASAPIERTKMNVVHGCETAFLVAGISSEEEEMLPDRPGRRVYFN